MEKIDEKEELRILRRIIVSLHTSLWTGNKKNTKKILELMGNYSYSLTNSNGGDDDDSAVDYALHSMNKWWEK
jgi:hypothetical protein